MFGHPLAGLAGVVEVEHRGDAVDAQPVDVELLQPVQGVGDQEVAHLRAPEVEDVGAPLGVLARAGSACSYSGVPSKRASAQSSLAKWAGTQSRITPMPAWCSRSISSRSSSGSPKRAVGAKYDGDLVAPGAAERVLHHRQQLDVGEAEVLRRSRRARRRAGRSERSSRHEPRCTS